MAGSRKKVVLRMEDQTTHAGYLPASSVVDRHTGEVQLLDVAGRLVGFAPTAIRYIAYVRDFNLDDAIMPERLLRKTFLARPRGEGLWVRITFRDGETLEGLAALDKTVLEDAIADAGIYLVPPDVRSNTQRLFVPRAAMAEMTLLGVVTSPSKLPVEKTPRRKHQDELALPFPESSGR
jgi:hypothetical protein